MPKNHLVQVRFSKEQRERVLLNAEIAGFSNLSHFIRDLALNYQDVTIRKIHEIHEKLMTEA